MNRPIPAPLARRKFPQVLIIEGKHATLYYLISSLDGLWDVSLEVLRRRVEVDRYIGEPAAEPSLQEGELSDEMMATMPATYWAMAKRVREENDEIRKQHRKAQAKWAEVQRIFKERDGLAAWEILDSRSAYEYEGFALEPLRVADGAGL